MQWRHLRSEFYCLADLQERTIVAETSGVSRVQDGSNIYCDLFYWCEKPSYQPIFFSCNHVVFGKGAAYYNHERKQCDSESNVYCPFPNRLYSNTSAIVAEHEKVAPLITVTGHQPNAHMMRVLESMADPAPGLQSLSPFNTSFTCSNNIPGYYPNPDYCDLLKNFHFLLLKFQ
jgi:hypothetical protein